MSERIRVGTLVELARDGVRVVSAGAVPVAVFHDGGRVHAVDNRCPHMGFPLHQGSVKDCVLTCHWHQARFDLASGSTFDLFADDVPAYDTFVEGGEVFVATTPRRHADAAWHRRRLLKGLDTNIGLLIAKSLMGLLEAGEDPVEIIRVAVRFASERSETGGQGLVLLGVYGNMLSRLSADTKYFALFRAVSQVAGDTAGAPPRRVLEPLDTEVHDQPHLAGWFRTATKGRLREGAMRVMMTSLRQRATDAELSDMLAGSDADRVYPATGHPFDAVNKAFELAALAGPDLRGALFPLVVDGVVGSRGMEENAGWHQPIEIIEPLRAAEMRLPGLLERANGTPWNDDGALGKVLLGENPLAIITALEGALGAGAPPADMAKQVALAAATRLARFASSNEVGDWFNPQHTFIFANAVHQAVKRSPTPAVVRAVFHAALAVYMDRFLNVPPAPLPGERWALDELPAGADDLCRALLSALDRHEDPDAAGRIVARYLRAGHPADRLVDALALATVREDLDFHASQVLEAGVRQFGEWAGRPEAELILVGVARHLAAFCPTRRAGHQTASIARRLHRGEKIFEEATP